ncbi:DUF4332 domain-containing protein [Demequina sp.]|uniref:DUF4332 domain-containing protein n=1 Tax=Demequina sp. TaxID=2050685 RepID=UPI0025C3FE47|nr:DUF4332 domain-containing protein [Demequina sp.]
MAYHLDDTTISLDRLKTRLARADLIPSQLLLRDDIDARFASLQSEGYSNLALLRDALRGSKGPARVSAQTSVPVDYLVVLRRVIEGMRPAPVALDSFPRLSPLLVSCLADHGIRDSKSAYETMLADDGIDNLASRTGRGIDELHHVWCLANVSRIQWVSPRVATALVAAGYESVARVAVASPDSLCADVQEANDSNSLYRGKVGVRDMARLIEFAGWLVELEGANVKEAGA